MLVQFSEFMSIWPINMKIHDRVFVLCSPKMDVASVAPLASSLAAAAALPAKGSPSTARFVEYAQEFTQNSANLR